MTGRRWLAALCLAWGMVLGGAGLPPNTGASLGVTPARADTPLVGAPASVLIILGSNQGAGSDAALAKLEALRKPPFDSFPKKQLLKRVDVQLSQGKEAEVELPNGRKLRLSLLERAPDGRFRVAVSINRPGKQDYLPLMTVVAAAGDPFFVAGQRHEGGTLIIGVSVGKPGA
ncbi:MAG TPA: hypothetical protein VFZ61_17875 [Polyangiales bacterium]